MAASWWWKCLFHFTLLKSCYLCLFSFSYCLFLSLFDFISPLGLLYLMHFLLLSFFGFFLWLSRFQAIFLTFYPLNLFPSHLSILFLDFSSFSSLFLLVFDDISCRAALQTISVMISAMCRLLTSLIPFDLIHVISLSDLKLRKWLKRDQFLIFFQKLLIALRKSWSSYKIWSLCNLRTLISFYGEGLKDDYFQAGSYVFQAF